jgi:hypothetical protein
MTLRDKVWIKRSATRTASVSLLGTALIYGVGPLALSTHSIEVVGVPPHHSCGVTPRPREMLARRLTLPGVHWTASSYGYLPAFLRFQLLAFCVVNEKMSGAGSIICPYAPGFQLF